MKRPHHSRGFTLVEILVCTTILGLLVGVSGAAYQKAMGKASLATEVNAGKNLVQSYLFAATENEGRYLAAYDSAARNQTVMNAKGRPLGMSEAKCRYPFRLAPYFKHQMDGTILVNRNEAQIIQIMGPSGTMYDYGLSVFPAFGINRYLVGGRVNSSGSVEYPSECIQRAAQAEKSPIVFISAGTTDVDGYEYVTAPMGPGGQWSSVKWSKGVDAANYGHVDGRYDGKAICAFLDGSVKVLSIDELRDMRLWSRNAALENNPNYQPK